MTHPHNLIFVQTVLLDEDVKKLREMTKASSIKDALYTAVKHYLSCSCLEGDEVC